MAQPAYPVAADRRLMPASPTALKPLILEALKDGPLRRSELVLKLQTLAPASGFFCEGPTGAGSAKKALRDLRDDKMVFNPQPSYWQIRDSEAPLEAQVQDLLDEDIVDEEKDGDDPLDGMEADTAAGLRIEHIVGEGTESVYLCYHDAHAEIARRDGLAVWEC